MNERDPHTPPPGEPTGSGEPTGRDVRVPDPHASEPAPDPDPHTREAPDAQVTRPDQQEELGPIGEMMSTAPKEAAAEVTGSEAAKAAAVREGAEAEGVEAAQIFGLMLATIISIAVAVAGVFFLVNYFADEEAEIRAGEALYPERLDIEAAAYDRLGNYAREDTLYRIPIEAAMSLVTREYNREQAGQQGLVEAPETYYMPAPNVAAATAEAVRGAGVPRPTSVPDTQLDAADSEMGAEVTDVEAGRAEEAEPGFPEERQSEVLDDDDGGDTR